MIVVAANPYRGAARPRARVDALVAALRATGATVRVVWEADERAALLGDPGAMADVRCVVAARADDGLLDWVAFERGGVSALARYAWAVLRGCHGRLSHVRSGRARRFTLTSAVPVPVQLDGEAAGFTPVEVEVLPAALMAVMV